MRGGAAPPKIYSKMIIHAVKSKKMYVDYPREKIKLTCLNNVPDKYSEQCKLLNNFDSRYATSKTLNESKHDTTIDNKYLKEKEVNDMVQNTIYYILQDFFHGKLI